MKDLLESGYEVEHLYELNICRMNLHATCLSEISTRDGKSLASDSIAGRIRESRDLYSWPPQSSPNKKIWEKWQVAL